MQPTPFCNIRCDYCYLAHRDDARFMPQEVVQATLRNLSACELVGSELSIVWHAGEPLVAPRSFYAEAFASCGTLLGGRTQVSHSVQTNGLLLDDDWCRLFRGHGVRVGVSLDGPEFLHDRHRLTRQGKGTHQEVMRGIECLRRNDVPFHVIAVATADTLQHAEAFIEFFVAQRISELGVNIDEQEGVNLRSSVRSREAEYSAFLRQLFERAAAADGRLRVRELSRMNTLITRGLPTAWVGDVELPDNEQVIPFAITTVDHEGNFSCFSPELVDQMHTRYGRFAFGNVRQGQMLDVLQDERFLRIYGDILAGVEQCRARCRYFALCGGGAPVNKLNENGSFATDETDYCRKTLQQPLEVALAILERELALQHRA